MADDGGPQLRGGSNKAIHPEQFKNRLAELYSYWQQPINNKFRGSNVFIIKTPKALNTLRSSISSILHIWLFGLEFPETTIIFTMNQINFICKNIYHTRLFEVLRDNMVDGGYLEIDMRAYTMDTVDDGIHKIDEIFCHIHELLPVVRVGYTAEMEVGVDGLLYKWYMMQRRPRYLEYNDVSLGFSEIFTLKNKPERQNIKRSAKLNYQVMDEYVVKILQYIVEKQATFSNSEISQKIQEVILDSTKVGVAKHERVNICYPPVVQSGDDFDLRPYMLSNDKSFYHGPEGTIICSIGSSYDDYCSYLARTYLISPTKHQIEVYTILLLAQKAAIKALRPGIRVCEVYEKAKYTVRLHDDQLLPHLTKSAGSGIGIEFSESILDVNPDNEMVVKKGMVFKISLGFENVLDQSTPSGNIFSMLLGDTVTLKSDVARVVTRSRKSLQCVTYPFKARNETSRGTVNNRGS